ncbi:peroxisomal membrane protein 11A [Senna tora]|uniref:Peroxisomal membrane protein 11A n=1 Tax=Senna tora TaxID=362788 RepID=A0A834X3Z9_9FABA|nr:peroxisomal membrane protein 11A [Senna tora]
MNSDSSSAPLLQPPPPKAKHRDFFNHLEAYLAKRDGVDKLLKISRYATKVILASSVIQGNPTLSLRLKTFESSVGVSRKAFRLGKFVQDLNALRNSRSDSKQEWVLSIIAYGGEGLYYFVEQFIWLAKSGLIDAKHSKNLQKISAWAEFIGYFGSIALKLGDLRHICDDEEILKSRIEVAITKGIGCQDEEVKLSKLREKKLMKKLSLVQDLADGFMTLDDIMDGKGPFSRPLLVSSAGLLSALISTHKNWSQTFTAENGDTPIPYILYLLFPFKRYVEIGRVALVNYGNDYGKLVVIVDVIDQNRALVDAPDMVRSQMNFKRLSLTDIKIDIKRVPKKKDLLQAMEAADVKKKWENSSWGRKLIVQKRRAALNDFDRFKLMLTKIKRAATVRQELAKLKKSAS